MVTRSKVLVMLLAEYTASYLRVSRCVYRQLGVGLCHVDAVAVS